MKTVSFDVSHEATFGSTYRIIQDHRGLLKEYHLIGPAGGNHSFTVTFPPFAAEPALREIYGIPATEPTTDYVAYLLEG